MSAVTILDGGMGKELRRIGAPFRQPEWSSLALMEAPDKVIEAHRNFIEAGAQVITTNNYAVVPYHHSPEFFAEHGVQLTELAALLAQRAVDESGQRVAIAGSMPPLFGSYEPDAFDIDLGAPIYRVIATALAPHVDLWIAETLSSVAEMTTIVAALDEIDAPQPVWISFTLPDEWDDETIAVRSGETIPEIVAALPDRVGAVLFNCSLPEQTGPALVELVSALEVAGRDVQIGAYANAFPTRRSEDYSANEVIFERRTELTASRYADFVESWIDIGATLVGGCCDMYPEHIAELTARVASRI